MRLTFRLAAPSALVALFLAPVPALAEAPSAPPPAPVAAPAPAPVARPALWKVADADTTIWLFGTVHVLRGDPREWLAGPVAGALGGSQTLVTEILPTDLPAAAATKVGLLPAGQSLYEVVGPARAERLRATFTKAGIPPELMAGIKPWFAAVALSMVPLTRAGYNTREGVERQLAAAHPQGQVGLETAEFQLGLMDGLPADAQLAWLDEVVENYDTIVPKVGEMIAAWRGGDAGRLGQLMTEDMDEDPRLREALITRRNQAWAKWIAARMAQPGSVFVAVGAGHLAGPGSVQDDLARAGLTVVRVQ